MRLAHLSLTNFRNFARLESEFPAGTTLLVGRNAQGKTSLLEAVHYLCGASSPHAGSDRQLINFLALRQASPFTRLVAEIERRDRPMRIEIRLVLDPGAPGDEPRLQKEILLNGVKRRVTDLGGGFNAILFLPQDMRVLEGAPAERRRHLDELLSQADPLYAHGLHEYGRALTQRNALLKALQERNGNGEELLYWDEQLAEHGASLIRARILALVELERLAIPIPAALTRQAERLRLEYLPSYDPAPPPENQLGLGLDLTIDRTGIAREAIREDFRTALAAARVESIARGATPIGPHRDDLRFVANGIDLRLYGSRGQNRTAMLSVKLAQVEWLHARTGEWPVLLLDEVLAELDQQRREDLLARVGTVEQSMLTGADLEMFSDAFRRHANIREIRGGTIISPKSG
jgi:DNA replication and repair protein RecF